MDRLDGVPYREEMSLHPLLHLGEAKAYVPEPQGMSAREKALEKRQGIGRSWTGWAKESFVVQSHCKLRGVGAALEVVERSQCPRSVPRSPWSQLAETA